MRGIVCARKKTSEREQKDALERERERERMCVYVTRSKAKRRVRCEN